MNHPSGPNEPDASTVAETVVPIDTVSEPGFGARIVSGLKWSGSSRGVQLACQLGTNTILARLLMSSDFGLLNMSATFLNIANAVADFGVRSFLIQKKDLSELEQKAALLVSWALGSGLFLVGLLASYPLAAFYREPGLVPLLIVQSSIYLVANVAGVQAALLSRKFAFARLARVEIFTSVFTRSAPSAWRQQEPGTGRWSSHESCPPCSAWCSSRLLCAPSSRAEFRDPVSGSFSNLVR